MLAKERVAMAIRHQEADRVPIGEWQFGHEIIESVIGRKTYIEGRGLRALQAYWKGRRDEVVDGMKRDLVEFIDKVKWDTVMLRLVIDKHTQIEVPEKIGERRWRDANGNVLLYSEETDRIFMVEQAEGPPPTAPAPERSPEPTDSELELIRYVVSHLGDRVFLMSSPLVGHPDLRFGKAGAGLEQWVKLYEDPDGWADRYLKAAQHPNTKLGVEIAKREGMDAVSFGTDFGGTTGPFMSPELFRKCILPGLAERCRIVHQAGLPVVLHSCGDNRPLLDYIVEAGVDVYQSIQDEMHIKWVKKRYGDRLALWGGISAGSLILGPPQEAKRIAAENIRACKPGGGFILGASHSLMPGSKWENYAAVLEAHREEGPYSS